MGRTDDAAALHVPTQFRAAGRRLLRALPESTQRSVRRYRNRSRRLPHLSIGILSGETPWALDDDSRWPAPIVTAGDVTDTHAAFVADPFAVERDGSWHLFFEVMNRRSGKGEIGYANSPDLLSWTYQGMVLVEPFHLSYPAIYQAEGQTWMIPETWESGQVRLYRADPFPSRWVLDRVLLDGLPATDPTLFQPPGGGWSMLLCGAWEAHNETLLRYDAPSLTGPWSESVGSPLVVGRPDQARPGGPCLQFDGAQYRLGQDCSRRYGERLRSFPLVEPWVTGGREVIGPTGLGWRARGGHHADFHPHPWSQGLIAFVDGES